MKKPGLWDHGVTTGGLGQKPDRRKMNWSVRQRYALWWVKKPRPDRHSKATDVFVENEFKKNEKTQVCETVVWPLADRIKNLIEKKMTWSVRQRYGLWRVKMFPKYSSNFFHTLALSINLLQIFLIFHNFPSNFFYNYHPQNSLKYIPNFP